MGQGTTGQQKIAGAQVNNTNVLKNSAKGLGSKQVIEDANKIKSTQPKAPYSRNNANNLASGPGT